jgi:hypothetical protein
MEWLGVIERFIDRWEIVMSVLISTGIVLLLPLLFPQLNSWNRIWSPYPGGWWLFVAFVFSASLMCCKIIKALAAFISNMRKIRKCEIQIAAQNAKISQKDAEIQRLRAQLKRQEFKMPIAGKF